MIPPKLDQRVEELLKDIFVDSLWHGTPVVIRVDEDVVFRVVCALETLQPREAECICLKYGITGDFMKVKSIGQNLPKLRNPESPVSAQRVYALVRQGLRKMRHPARISRVVNAMATAAGHPRRSEAVDGNGVKRGT